MSLIYYCIHTYCSYSKDAHISLQLQQRRDSVLCLQHLWVTSLVTSIPYASHVNAANDLANGHSFPLTWLPIAAAPPSKDESDESDTEEPKGMEDMGQVLLAEVLEEVEEGDEDEGEALLSALGVAVWYPPVSIYITMFRLLCSPSSEAPAYLQLLNQC